MNEQETSTPVPDDVILNNSLPSEPDQTAIQALAARVGDLSVILDVLAEAIDTRDKTINDLTARLSDLEQVAQPRRGFINHSALAKHKATRPASR